MNTVKCTTRKLYEWPIFLCMLSINSLPKVEINSILEELKKKGKIKKQKTYFGIFRKLTR